MKLEIPNNWQQIPLEQLLELVTGGDWGKDESFSDPDFALAYCIRGSEIRNWETKKGTTASLRKVKKASIESRRLKEGDILVEISGGGPEQPVGRTVLIDKTALSFQPQIPKICTNFLRLIRPVKGVDSKYLNLFLKLFYASGDIVNYQGGSNNLRNLKFPDYVKIKIPFPSLSEQQAIVSKVEEFFSDLEKGNQQLETTRQQLKVYRQSVLKAAFEGRLTNKKVNGELPKNWQQLNISDVAQVNPKLPDKEKIKNDLQVQFLPMKLVEELVNKIHLTETKSFIDVQKGSYTPFINGDVIFAKVTPCMENGKIAVVEKLKNGIGYGSSEFHVIRSNKKLNSKYIFYFLVQEKFRKEAEYAMTGAVGLRRVPKQFIENYSLPLPPLVEQNKIVSEIESRLTICDKLEETISKNLQQAETLRHSILKKAFEGRLVAAVSVRSGAKVIPLPIAEFPRKILGISETDLQVGIISMVIDLHQINPKHSDKLSHVKCEKISDLVERKLGISLGRFAMKDAAGPDDFPHLKKVEHRANKAGYFRNVALQPIGHTYKPMRNMHEAITKTKNVLTGEELKEVSKLLETFLPFELEHAELVATLFAGWNNLLLLGKQPTDEEIVFESRENWSKRKLTIPREIFFNTLSWMRRHNYLPEGKGQMVLKKNEVEVKLKEKKTTRKKK